MKRGALLATLSVLTTVAIASAVVVPSALAAEASDPICSTDVKSDIKFDQALSGNCPTIQLNGPISLSSTRTINKSVVIDLNGYTISGGSAVALTIDGVSTDVSLMDSKGTGKVTADLGESGAITVENGATLTVGDGATVENTHVDTDAPRSPAITNRANLIINVGATLKGKDGVGSFGASKLTVNGGEIRGNDGCGIETDGRGATIEIKGGYIYGSATALGAQSYSESTPSTINISGGELESADMGIAFAVPGTLTMTGGTVEGTVGVSVSGGAKVDIRGGEIIADGSGSLGMPSEIAGVAVLVMDPQGTSKVTISAPTVINASNEYPVATATIDMSNFPPDFSYVLDPNNTGKMIVVNAGVRFAGTRPAVAYLADGLVVGPNGVVMTVAEAEAMEGATENPENPNTADAIALYVMIGVVALIGLGATVVLAKRINRC